MLNIFKSSTSVRFFLSINLWPKKYSTQSFKPFYENFFKYSDKIAVIDRLGYYSYQDILHTSCLVAKKLSKVLPNNSEISERISFLCPNEAIYVSVLLACWITGNIAVPLSSNHPKTLLEYIITNSQSSVLIASNSFSDMAQNISTNLKINHIIVDSIVKGSMKNLDPAVQSAFFSWDSSVRERKALIIYTSGTTGLPKGVALSHGNLFAQVSSLVKAWEISSCDTILHTLPLYHMHGIMNALLCLLSVGGTVVMRPKFNAFEVWSYFMNKDSSNNHISLYFGVPTMYVMLIDAYQKMFEGENIKNYCKENIRLMTCGSAPLVEPVFHQWEKITGHYLLERFGMSEIGMALSNPLNGPRVPGSVGNPLPTVEVKIVEDSSSIKSITYVEGNDSFVKVSPDCENEEGELLVRGPTVFKEYWNNKKATHEAFTHDGWFKTGDTCAYKNGSFKILGRMSADIIKSAGYKISALSIETCLLTHPQISDCSVMGVPDEKWGERVAALIVTKDNKEINETELKAWCEKSLPSYTVPSVIKYVNVIPRNPMGKMNKNELKKIFS